MRPFAATLTLALLAAPAFAEGVTVAPNGSRMSQKGNPVNFSGSVRIERLFSPAEGNRAAGGQVTFEPGARTVWHTHPAGQTLIVTSGLGWVQERGGPKREIRPGDVVWIAPGVEHWHGATTMNGMTHIAIQEAVDGKVVDWLEKVAYEQYRE